MSSSLPVSAYIDIAPNEYVTKYSFNRNFEKLLSNDNYLYDMYSVNVDSSMSESQKLCCIQTYNKLKTYSAGEFAFYKISKSDTKFYILSSAQGPNTHKPTVRQNLETGELYVVNSDWWVIVGAKSTDKGASLPKDDADQYVSTNKYRFELNHEQNEDDPAAHPTGKLGLQESSKAFKSMENILPDRSKMFYPSYLQSVVADQTILAGYMRKWENGLLEYDLTFRLGYISSDAGGIDILSTNNFVAGRTPKNYLYFRDSDDYSIFNRHGDNYAVTPTSKQYNLVPSMNAYVGKIDFPEHFKDLNYMVFTSNVKNIETEAYSLQNNAIASYDSRLKIDGLTIVGTSKDAVFTRPCTVPNEVVNINSYALANIEQVDDVPVVFNIDPWQSSLININSYAFFSTGIESIDIPASTRYIGPHAFENCPSLTCVNFYVYENDKAHQVRIDKQAFDSNVKQVHIYYKTRLLMGAAREDPSHEDAFLNNIDLYSKIYADVNYRLWIGLPLDVRIFAHSTAMASRQTMLAASPIVVDATVVDDVESDGDGSANKDSKPQPNVFTIDVDEFIHELQQSTSGTKSPKMRLAAVKPAVDINTVFKMSGTEVTGFNASSIDGLVGFNLNDLATKPTAIRSNALVGFSQLTSLTANDGLTGIYPNAFDPALEAVSFTTASSKDYKLSIDIQLDSLSVNFAAAPASFTLSAANRLDDVYIAGTSVPSNAIYASGIKNLYVDQVQTVSSNAFYQVDSIAKCTLKSSSTYDTSLYSSLFKSISAVDSDDDTYYTGVVGSIDLVGSRFDIKPHALCGMTVQHLSIDLSSTHISAEAFLNSSIDTISFVNSPAVFFNALGNACFRDCYLLQLEFDKGIDDLTSNARMLNADNAKQFMIPGNPLVRGTDGIAFLSVDGYGTGSATYHYIDAMGRYFEYDDSNQISGYTSSLTADDIEDLVIPYGATGIVQNVFNAALHSELNTKIDIGSIYIPSTVKSIGDNAFKGLSALNKVASDPGTDLTYFGENSFQNCQSLQSMHFRR